MKKLFLLIPALMTGFILFTGQTPDNSAHRWSPDPRMTRLYPVGDYVQLPRVDNYVPNTQIRTVSTPTEVFTIYPNFAVHPSFGHQTEVPICRHPSNPLIMLASANTYRGGGAGSLSVGAYVTTDGGVTWFGSDTLNNGTFNYGDPGPTIDKDGRFHMTFISNTGKIGASFSTNNGINWSPEIQIPNSTTNSDKNLAASDDIPSSAYYGRSYVVFTEFAGVNNGRVVISYTTNGGVNWSNEAPVSPPPIGSNFHQGADVRVGSNGEVLVVWANNSGVTPVEDSLGFAKSTNGGVNWVVSRCNASDMNGIRDFSSSFMGIRVNGFPRIAVDKSTGPRRGWIYVTTAEKNLAPSTDLADIVLHRSTDGGTTWTKARVNQDTPGNGKKQFFAAVDVDDQGGLNVVYYDTRNTPTNDSCETYLSRSLDGGNSFVDILISDRKFKPKSISGLAGGYMGDYLGITSGNSTLWPYWCDDREGIFQAYTARVNINLNPLSNYNLTSPAPGTTLVGYPNSNINYTVTWDTASSSATYKWIFGNPTTTPRKITIPSTINYVNFTANELNNILAGLGVAVGDSLVGQWDVWAFRNNIQQDSLKAANGPRAVTLKRGIPPLTPFSLYQPPAGTRIVTSGFDFTNVRFNWASSGPGVTYKMKIGWPNISTPKIIQTSALNGVDSSFTFINNELDGLLAGLGVNPGDSVVGQWSVWAYNGFDSVKAAQNNSITLRRSSKGDVIVLYDSTSANCRISRDSVVTNLIRLQVTYELYNRKGSTSTDAVSFRGYKKVMVLGEGSSVMSNKVRDSVKSYLASGTAQNKAKLIIIGEDVGYQIDRVASPTADTAFARSMCGFQFVADRPGVGGRGIIGVTINVGLPDSTYGPSSDVIARSGSVPSSQTFNLYKYRLFPDSINAVGRVSPTYNVAVMALDAESIRPTPDNPNPFAVKRILSGLLKFVDEIPTSNEPGISLSIPQEFSLSQNYPNPFNPSTKISFSIPVSELVTLKIFDVLGKEVATLVNEKRDAGSYNIEFNAANLPSGIYMYRIKAGNYVETRRMMLLK
jgi:hypothetical protein